MKIGLALHSGGHLDSVTQFARRITEICSDSHRVLQLPPAADYMSRIEGERAAEEVVSGSDVLVGFSRMLLPLLAARSRLGIHRPCLLFVQGAFPRGAITIRPLLPYLTTSDLLIANCSADVKLIHKFAPEAQVELLPWPFDSKTFYPLPPDERMAVREQLGITGQSQMLLYAGRLTVEKNLHTVLRAFAAIHQVQSDTHLLLAGPVQDVPFLEFGVAPLHYAQSIDKAIKALQLPVECVRYLGRIEGERLRLLYNAADAMINLTLHHDENFGLAQVEAIACGTPVIGTAWGGLRDTIQDGINGFKVRTVVSRLGVKVDWWDATNKALLLLAERARDNRFDRTTVQATSAAYLPERFHTRLEALLTSVAQRPPQETQRLSASRFAQEFWDVCAGGGRPNAQYIPGSYSFQLYRELILSYADSTAECATNEPELESTDILSLASPVVTVVDNATLRVGDPLYPFECRIPEDLSTSVTAVLTAMLEEPAITVSRLTGVCLRDHALARNAIGWMLSLGLILRSGQFDGSIAPDGIRGASWRPPFAIQKIDRYTTDFVVFE